MNRDVSSHANKREGPQSIKKRCIYGRTYQVTTTADGTEWCRIGGGYQRLVDLENRMLQLRLKRQEPLNGMTRWSSQDTYILSTDEATPKPKPVEANTRSNFEAKFFPINDTLVDSSPEAMTARRPTVGYYDRNGDIKSQRPSLDSNSALTQNFHDFDSENDIIKDDIQEFTVMDGLQNLAFEDRLKNITLRDSFHHYQLSTPMLSKSQRTEAEQRKSLDETYVVVPRVFSPTKRRRYLPKIPDLSPRKTKKALLGELMNVIKEKTHRAFSRESPLKNDLKEDSQKAHDNNEDDKENQPPLTSPVEKSKSSSSGYQTVKMSTSSIERSTSEGCESMKKIEDGPTSSKCDTTSSKCDATSFRRELISSKYDPTSSRCDPTSSNCDPSSFKCDPSSPVDQEQDCLTRISSSTAQWIRSDEASETPTAKSISRTSVVSSKSHV
ncbi:unnamed protein product [Bursaphelenchus okinawaensis]|uniref:Uncharacterized protein n=1 Tax=Bursaphelenchus okinawaensis TaxID=465554 RepID=A0A811JQ23_9BILA|nr:unnamed protein product [Bursaphelenchus okinawaensis]CAG9077416.1 unnamed protein product [Bursaphelenchus okinawaensis]